MSFAGAEVSWNRQSPEVLYGSYYDGIVQRTISRRTSENGDMISAKIHASQGFDRCFEVMAAVEFVCEVERRLDSETVFVGDVAVKSVVQPEQAIF